jgi:hypothetical protein
MPPPIEALEALGAERDDTALLLTIKAALKRRHVNDFEVRGGYRPFVEGDERIDWVEGIDWDEENDFLINYEGIYYTRGMFRCLESCAREDPSGQTIKAIRIAFALGQASIVGTTDPEKVERALTTMEKQERRYKKGGTTTGPEKAADAKERHRVLKRCGDGTVGSSVTDGRWPGKLRPASVSTWMTRVRRGSTRPR